ncbi:Nin1 binding protein [Quaeritorhiza haematococci]|nr:Nin1 binding protein [Quaeritorhiza haematococci]
MNGLHTDQYTHVNALVLDTAPLLKGNVHTLQNLNVDKFYTIPQVLAEVRDAESRDGVKRLNVDINVREPSEEAFAAVSAFAKKTGDFAVLSITDLKVLALTYMLEKELNSGVAHLRTEPLPPQTQVGTPQPAAPPTQPKRRRRGGKKQREKLQKQQQAASAEEVTEASTSNNADDVEALPSTEEKVVEGEAKSKVEQEEDENVKEDEEMSEEEQEEREVEETGSEEEEEDEEEEEEEEEEVEVEEEAEQHADAAEEESESENVAEEDDELATSDAAPTAAPAAEESSTEAAAEPEAQETQQQKPDLRAYGWDDNDDEGGWITPRNVHRYKNNNGGPSRRLPREEGPLKVACMTADFAAQNVVLQMNMKLLSVDGMRITRLKSWVLRCHVCFKSTKDLEKKFCPSCGKATLIRTSVGVDAQGNMVYYLKKNFQYNLRGTKYSIPVPKGGRKNQDIILTEDQREYQKALQQHKRYQKKAVNNLFDPDFVPLQSRGSEKGGIGGWNANGPIIGFGRKNPNESRKPRRR